MNDGRISERPRTAPTLTRHYNREYGTPQSPLRTLWKGHTPGEKKKVEVMTLDAMGTTEKLHNSHFYNISVAATSQKHKTLIMNAKSRISTQLHPFVLSEQARLKSKKHLKGVDELTKNVDMPDALKHHAGFHQVYGWLLTHEQHTHRMEQLQPSISVDLPKHCKQYR